MIEGSYTHKIGTFFLLKLLRIEIKFNLTCFYLVFFNVLRINKLRQETWLHDVKCFMAKGLQRMKMYSAGPIANQYKKHVTISLSFDLVSIDLIVYHQHAEEMQPFPYSRLYFCT